MSKIIKVNFGERGYPIIIQNGILDKIGKTLSTFASLSVNSEHSRIVIITDRNVAPLYLSKVTSSLKKSGLKCLAYIIPAGEKQKSLATVNKIHNFLVRNKTERNDTMIALGGGVIGDIAGFVAGTYKRGMKFIQVPTSLLAQVDSSIGGKTGVNHPSGKNLIGIFYQPSAVLIDPLTLKTLPKREFYNGMAEVIKAAIIKNAQLFKFLVNKHKQIKGLKPIIITRMLAQAIMVKKHLVEPDEYDSLGKRILLNYGHTFGHILESLGRYRHYKHGEAVAIGMMAAARIACQMGLVKDDFIRQQESVLRMYDLPVKLEKSINFTKALVYLKQDKKMTGGKVFEVLPSRIGSAKAYQIPLTKFR